MRRHILVIGGTGYIGSRVVWEMTDMHDVRVLTRRPAQASAWLPVATEVLQGDIRNPNALALGMMGISDVIVCVRLTDAKQTQALYAQVCAVARRALVSRVIWICELQTIIQIQDMPPSVVLRCGPVLGHGSRIERYAGLSHRWPNWIKKQLGLDMAVPIDVLVRHIKKALYIKTGQYRVVAKIHLSRRAPRLDAAQPDSHATQGCSDPVAPGVANQPLRRAPPGGLPLVLTDRGETSQGFDVTESIATRGASGSGEDYRERSPQAERIVESEHGAPPGGSDRLPWRVSLPDNTPPFPWTPHMWEPSQRWQQKIRKKFDGLLHKPGEYEGYWRLIYADDTKRIWQTSLYAPVTIRVLLYAEHRASQVILIPSGFLGWLLICAWRRWKF